MVGVGWSITGCQPAKYHHGHGEESAGNDDRQETNVGLNTECSNYNRNGNHNEIVAADGPNEEEVKEERKERRIRIPGV